MIKRTRFISATHPYAPAGFYTDTDLGLITQKLEISPAKPKTTYIDLPGADGSADLTESLGLGVLYEDRTIRWTFALYESQDWYETMSRVSNYLNGLRFDKIFLGGDPDYYWTGRCTVDSHASDEILRQIVVVARVAPYKTHNGLRSYTFPVTATETNILVDAGARLNRPTLSATVATKVTIPSPVSGASVSHIAASGTALGEPVNGKRSWKVQSETGGTGTLTIIIEEELL